MKIESELRVVAHGDLPTQEEVNNIPEPSEEEALFRIVANTKSVEIKLNELSPQLDGSRSNDGNG
jgi:hypothetical protein